MRLGGFAPDLERIVALRPDLAVVSRDGTDRRPRIASPRSGSASSSPTRPSLAGVFEDIRRVGSALGATVEGRATRRGAGGAATSAAQARSAARRGSVRPSALALIWPDPPVVAGPATFVGDLLARAGLSNVVPASAGEWPRVSHETLVAWNPGVVVRPETVENGAAFRAAFAPGSRWRLLPAVREGRVVVLPGAWLERPGPRLVDALEALVERLREVVP